MRKYVLVFLMLMFSVLMLKGQYVEVDIRHPASCRTGDRCIVDVVITKEDVSGFARFQQVLPEGVSAEVIEDGGGEFIFERQRVAFIWLRLPEQEQVRISYRLVFNSSVVGHYEITEGLFSYLVDNRTRRYELDPLPVSINKAPLPRRAVAEEAASKEDQPVAAEVPRADEQTETEKKPERMADERHKVAKPEPVTTDHKASQVSEGVGIEKVTAPEPDHDQPVRDTMPKEQPVTERKITPPAEEAPVTERKIAPPAEEVPVTERTEPVKEKPEPIKVSERKVDLTEAPEKHVPEVEAVKQQEVVTAPVKEEAVAPVSTGSEYRVQIVALRTNRPVESVRNQFNLSEQVFVESADGWYRYTFGPFRTRAEADEARAAFANRTGGNAMVVKYRDGVRVR